MKKCLTGMLLLLLVLSLSACRGFERQPAPDASETPDPTASESNNTLPEPVSVKKNGMTVSVLPQVELISILQYMGKDNLTVRYGLISRYYSDYKLAIDQHFRDYDQHPAVLFYDAIESMSIDEPAAWALLLQPDFMVDREAFKHHNDVYRDGYLSTIEELQDFFDVLRDFAVTSGFNEFYAEHADYYRDIVNDTAALLPEEDIIGRMEGFFGQRMDSFNVVLVSLFHSGGFGPDVQKNGERHNYSLIGPTDAADHIPVFCDEVYFADLELHELGHSFIPIANEKNGPFAELVKESELLFAPIEEAMKSNAYEAWETALEELILRGCVIKIVEGFDTARSAELLEEERASGFIYIDSVCDSIDDYLQNRESYDSFNDFVPELIRSLITEYAQR